MRDGTAKQKKQSLKRLDLVIKKKRKMIPLFIFYTRTGCPCARRDFGS